MSKRMVGRLLLAIAGLGLGVAFSGCGSAEDPWKNVRGGPTRVLTSFAPLACFTQNVAKEHAAVQCLATTRGPHDYEPDASDHMKAGGANLLLLNGLGLDGFATGIIGTAKNASLKVVKVGEAIPDEQLLTMGAQGHHHHGHDHGADDHHDHGFYDPHVWLGIPEATVMVGRIRDALTAVDPAHKDEFARNAADYVLVLAKLQAHGKSALADKKNKKIVATHDSLQYFARSFGLEIVGNLQPQPGIEADATKLAELVERCKKDDVHVITVEPQYPHALAETLQRELNARGVNVAIVEVDTLETADPPIAAGWYVERMRRNIDNLAEKLK